MKYTNTIPPEKLRRVKPRFRGETRFELTPRFDLLTEDSTQRAFEQLKARLLNPVLNHASDPTLRHQLRLAANEAAAVAWTTPYPLLVLPMLLEEKADRVHSYTRRQEQVEQSTHQLVLATL